MGDSFEDEEDSGAVSTLAIMRHESYLSYRKAGFSPAQSIYLVAAMGSDVTLSAPTDLDEEGE